LMDVIIFNNDKEGSTTFSLSFFSLSQIKFNGGLFFPAPWPGFLTNKVFRRSRRRAWSSSGLLQMLGNEEVRKNLLARRVNFLIWNKKQSGLWGFSQPLISSWNCGSNQKVHEKCGLDNLSLFYCP